MSEERIFSIPESLLVGILNYLALQPYQNVVSLINEIQAVIQKEQGQGKKQGGKEK